MTQFEYATLVLARGPWGEVLGILGDGASFGGKVWTTESD
jgi:hypothetical protein